MKKTPQEQEQSKLYQDQKYTFAKKFLELAERVSAPTAEATRSRDNNMGFWLIEPITSNVIEVAGIHPIRINSERGLLTKNPVSNKVYFSMIRSAEVATVPDDDSEPLTLIRVTHDYEVFYSELTDELIPAEPNTPKWTMVEQLAGQLVTQEAALTRR